MSDIGKTLNYMKRNGIVRTVYAIKERVDEKKTLSYAYEPVSEEERLKQLERALDFKVSFSIVVPAYETDPGYLDAMIASVRAQTYPKWELIIADASLTDTVKNIAEKYDDIRIRYIRLKENKGISENTNEALKLCTGDYTGLLDHDDLLSNDALYENARAIAGAESYGIKLQMIYSDEDKTDAENTGYFEINRKPKFNYDLILSNDYICHFMLLKTELLKELKLRSRFDGAQDYDLILRTVSLLKKEHGDDYEPYIYHIGRVLYHWRAHEGSTASNTKSKVYAYEAGLAALNDFLKENNIAAKAVHSAHFGFYNVVYEPDIFSQRKEVCAVGGRIIGKKGRVIGGVYDEDKRLLFEGLSVHNSGGYLHRADCRMEVPYMDMGSMKFAPFAVRILNGLIDENNLSEKPLNEKELSFKFCDIMKDKGYKFVYEPGIVIKAKEK